MRFQLTQILSEILGNDLKTKLREVPTHTVILKIRDFNFIPSFIKAQRSTSNGLAENDQKTPVVVDFSALTDENLLIFELWPVWHSTSLTPIELSVCLVSISHVVHSIPESNRCLLLQSPPPTHSVNGHFHSKLSPQKRTMVCALFTVLARIVGDYFDLAID